MQPAVRLERYTLVVFSLKKLITKYSVRTEKRKVRKQRRKDGDCGRRKSRRSAIKQCNNPPTKISILLLGLQRGGRVLVGNLRSVLRFPEIMEVGHLVVLKSEYEAA